MIVVSTLTALGGANDFHLLPQLTDSWRTMLEIPLDSKRPCVIDFGASWCMPCLQFSPTYNKCAKEYGDRIDMVSCDYDKNRVICSNYRVQVLPTIILFDASGKPFKRFEAAPTEKEFRQALEELLAFSGCYELSAGDNGEVYYTLDGRPVANPEKGLYILRKGFQSRLVRVD